MLNNFSDRIYIDLQYNASKILTYDSSLFFKRLSKIQVDEPSYMNYETDIVYIKDRYGNYDDFVLECEEIRNRLHQVLIEDLKVLPDVYQKYENDELGVEYNKCTLHTNHNYLSIDIHDAGFQSLIYLGVIKSVSSWNELICKCTDNPLICKSKAFKVSFLREIEYRYNVNLHKLIVPLMNVLLKSDVVTNNFNGLVPNLFLGDELVYDITGHYNDYNKLLGDKTIDDIYVGINKFKYVELGCLSDNGLLSIFPIRKYPDKTVMPYKSSNLYWIYYDYYHNIEPEESDYMVQIMPDIICKCEFDNKILVGKELEDCKNKYRIIM